MIRRCTALPGNFPVTDDMVFLHGQCSLAAEMKVSRVLARDTLNVWWRVDSFLILAEISHRKETYSCVTTSFWMEPNRTSSMGRSSTWWLLLSFCTKHPMISWCQSLFRWDQRSNAANGEAIGYIGSCECLVNFLLPEPEPCKKKFLL